MKKNILHVFSGEYKVGNGIFSVVDTLFSVIDSTKFRCTLFCKDKEDQQFNYLVFDKREITFKKLLLKNNYDLIIFHGIFFKDYLQKFSLCIKNNIPYLIKPHGSLVEKSLYKSRLKKKVFFMFGLSYYINKSKGIIYINKEERNNSIQINVANYLEPNLIGITPRFEKEDSERIRLLFFSRIDFNHKGLDYLLSALTMLNNDVTDKIVFDFYGIGNNKSISRLKSFLIKYNLNFVKYRGNILSNSDKLKMFSKSDILVLTSRYEGYPTVITEALAFGIPPIVTPGTNSLFLPKQNIGWYTKLDSYSIAKQIENSVKEFIDNKISIRLKCISFVENNLGLNNISVTEDLYTYLCEKH